MNKAPNDQLNEQVMEILTASKDICVAVDDHLKYMAFNEAACTYLKIKPQELVGKNAVQLHPEIIASKNHRNILRALSGVTIPEAIVESRMGDTFKASYTPVFLNNEVKAVIIHATLHSQVKK